MTTRQAAAPLTFREVTSDTWDDFEQLFASVGGPKSCWCMVCRASPEEARRTDGTSRKRAMARRVRNGTPIGILGYLDGQPVAWCSVAPRSTYRRLVSNAGDDEGIWSIACFFVIRKLRGTAVARQALAAAVAHARNKGARIVESYPVDPDSPSYRFMGFVSLFAEAGFEHRGREGKRRHIMQLDLATRSS